MSWLRRWMDGHQRLLELAVDLLAGWSFGCGLMGALWAWLTPSAVGEITAGGVMLCCVAGILTAGVVSRRRWILPCGAGTGAAVVWLLSKTNYWEPAAERLWVYWSWVCSGCPAPENVEEFTQIPDGCNPIWLQLLIGIGCCGAMFFLMRRAFYYLAMLAGSAGAIGATALGVYQGRTQADTLYFVTAVMLMGLIMVLPRVHAKYLDRLQAGGKEGAAVGGRTAITRISLQILAVPAAALCVGMAFWIVPEDASAWKSQLLTNLVWDIGDLFRFSTGTSKGYWEFSLSSASYQPLGERLGGPVELSDNRIFTVKTEDPVLLKGSVQDTYTGTGWKDSENNGRFRLESMLWSGRRKDAMGLEQPKDQTARELYLRLTKEVTLEIFPVYYRYCTIFTPGRLEDAAFRTASGQTLYFNGQGEVFTEDLVGSAYRVTGRVFLPRSAGIDREMELLERLASSGGRDRAYDEIAQQYLQLPDSLPERVRQTAQEIVQRGDSPYRQAADIADWLQKNCTYTLTPAEPPEGRDFVDWFLETREGYCVYYASAMTVLARCAGLPARYVSGFGLKEERNKNWYYISDASGHAWTEIYFAGIGWVPFDPLEWSPVQEPAQQEPRESSNIQWPEGEEEEDEEGSAELPENLPEPAAKKTVLGWILLVLLLLGGISYGIVAVWRYPHTHWRAEAVRKRCPLPEQWVEAVYGDLLRQLRLVEFSIQPGETLMEFATRVDGRFLQEQEDHPMQRIAGWITAWRFGGLPPPVDGLEWFCGYHSRLERLVQIRLGKQRYFWRRGCARVVQELRKR